MAHRMLATLLLLVVARPASAWNAAGHMVSASIAYDVLEQDEAAALARVLELPRRHPQYADHFAPKLVLSTSPRQTLRWTLIGQTHTRPGRELC